MPVFKGILRLFLCAFKLRRLCLKQHSTGESDMSKSSPAFLVMMRVGSKTVVLVIRTDKVRDTEDILEEIADTEQQALGNTRGLLLSGPAPSVSSASLPVR